MNSKNDVPHREHRQAAGVTHPRRPEAALPNPVFIPPATTPEPERETAVTTSDNRWLNDPFGAGSS
ncbi:hypothetical protein [Streptomyces sp. MZ04]|uniref:hypothetical protein n=1 Tax=Streptomyces sp. MZ04 TaxID=2559236 RepID=UPI00107EA38E|nr:hypothetical protein [Streptomyces sp. MZ04]TGB05588.1 hypothetical protein E2651_24775 [Streptomyces sp. MZ04]